MGAVTGIGIVGSTTRVNSATDTGDGTTPGLRAKLERSAPHSPTAPVLADQPSRSARSSLSPKGAALDVYV